MKGEGPAPSAVGREPWVPARGDPQRPLEPRSGGGAGGPSNCISSTFLAVPVGATLRSTALRAQNTPRWRRRFSCHACRLTEDSPRDAPPPSAALGAQGCPRSAVRSRVYAGRGGGSPRSGWQLLPAAGHRLCRTRWQEAPRWAWRDKLGLSGVDRRQAPQQRTRAGPVTQRLLVFVRVHVCGAHQCVRRALCPSHCHNCHRGKQGFEMALKFIIIRWRPHSLYCATCFGNG